MNLFSNLALVAALLGAAVAPRPAPPPPPPAPQAVAAWALPPRERLMAVAISQIGTQEASGRNDGPVVKYLRSVGLYAGDPYCAAFVYWCGREALGPANPFPGQATRRTLSPVLHGCAAEARRLHRGTPSASTFRPKDASPTRDLSAESKGAPCGRWRRIRRLLLPPVRLTATATASGPRSRPLSTIHSVRRWLP
jgi:hypothetical protein